MAATRGVSGNQRVVTAREIGRREGISHQAVLKWVEEPGWSYGPPPWTEQQAVQIAAWRRRTLRPRDDGELDVGGTVTSSDERRANTRLKNIRAAREAFELNSKRGKVHDVSACEAKQVRKVFAVRDRLTNFADSLPVDTPPHVKQYVRDGLERICREFAEGR